MLSTLLRSPTAHGALGGFLTAAAIDFQAFRSWKTFSQFVSYDWATALFRWAQGAVVGALTTSTLGALLG